MIANARMYSVSPAVGELWRALLSRISAEAGLPMTWMEHTEPAPIEELWDRTDQGAVFMCGLPFARAQPQPVLVAVPVPSPPEFGGEPIYWSDFVVREDSDFRILPDTFGGRLALTVPGSQSGSVAALSYFMAGQPARAATLDPGATPTGAATAGPQTTLPTDAAPDTATVAVGNEHPLFREIIAPTITPLGALNAVIRGAADVAPIDSYALRLLQRYRPDLTSQVRVVGQTTPTPIPPLVAAPAVAAAWTAPEKAALHRAFLEAHRNVSTKALMAQLLLERFDRPVMEGYAALRQKFETAIRYWSAHRLAADIHPAFAP